MRKINRALKHPPYWVWIALGTLLLVLCVLNHFYVYHHLSPLYLRQSSQEVLIAMYVLKTVSMFFILAAGLFLILGHYPYWRRMWRE